MLLTYLEQQNKLRLLAARQRQQDASTDVSQPPRASMMQYPTDMEPLGSRNSALDNHQMQLMLLEQQNKKRLLLSSERQTATSTEASLLSLNPPVYHPDRSAPGDDAVYALQDYQMQLMLLEQQNKKRALMLRQGQTAACSAPSHSAPDPTGQNQA